MPPRSRAHGRGAADQSVMQFQEETKIAWKRWDLPRPHWSGADILFEIGLHAFDQDSAKVSLKTL